MIRRHNVRAHLRKLIEEPGDELFDGRWWYRFPFRSTAGDDSSKVSDGTIQRRSLLVALAAGPLLMLSDRPGRLPGAGLSGKTAMFARKESRGG